jgi:hypothetical protein
VQPEQAAAPTGGSAEPTAALVIDAKTAPAGMNVRIKCMNNIHQVTAACGPPFQAHANCML